MKLCSHFDQLKAIEPQTPTGCAECLAMGGKWVHLRLCLECGHVGCCDNSAGTHATKHFHSTQHAAMRSFEPGEDWGWCYVHDEMFEPLPTFGLRRLSYE